MIVHVALVFLVPVLSGALVVHLLWPDREIVHLFLKFFLGIGVGLGISSLQYFVYLFFFAGQTWFIAVELATFLILLLAAISAERKRGAGSRTDKDESPPTDATRRRSLLRQVWWCFWFRCAARPAICCAGGRAIGTPG